MLVIVFQNYPDGNILMKIFINFIILKFESLKKLSLGKKIVIATVFAILAQAFGIIFL
jgi:hypothetical protein